MRLVNFFYGNRVPCFLAIQLFYECNDYADARMTEDFNLFYEAYEKNTDAVHMGIYFDVWHEKFLYINGINKNQLEIVESEDPLFLEALVTVVTRKPLPYETNSLLFHTIKYFYSFQIPLCPSYSVSKA